MSFVPTECHMDELKSDFESVKNMIYGVYPSFEVLMEYVRELEDEINRLGHKEDFEV